MYLNNIRTTLVRFSITMVLVIATVTAGSAQSGENVQSGTENDTTGNRDRRLAETKAARGAKPTASWLIFDGELIPGPYNVVVEDSAVLVNGRIVAAPPPPKKKREVDSATIAAHQLIVSLVSNFASWVTEYGIEVARQRALKFMRKQSIIDTAYVEGISLLWFKFRSKSFKECMDLVPPRTRQKTVENRLQEKLAFVSGRLRAQLNAGNLVIMQYNGGLKVITYPRSIAVLEELQTAATEITDLEERIAAVRNILNDDRPARAIAERFMQK